MEKLHEVIQNYEENRISLEELQEFIWGLSESKLETIPEDKLIDYLSLGYKRVVHE
ncbi:hypothetical protein [Desemzia sp. FAM 24101]|uniref:hypothetical protein n=1 Tax=unclassified Desemzia TaxID=2685243 RepID=UPI0038895EE3